MEIQSTPIPLRAWDLKAVHRAKFDENDLLTFPPYLSFSSRSVSAGVVSFPFIVSKKDKVEFVSDFYHASYSQ